MARDGRLRSMKWSDYGISEERYRELKHFCQQYNEKRRKAKGLEGHESEAVEGMAYKRAENALRDCRMIEEAAMWAANKGCYGKAWRAVLYAVTQGAGYDMVAAKYDVPFSVADFYGVRRAFFYRLDQLQNGDESG